MTKRGIGSLREFSVVDADVELQGLLKNSPATAQDFFDYFAGHNHVKPSKMNFNTLLHQKPPAPRARSDDVTM